MDLRAGFTRINNLSLPLNYGIGVDQKVGFSRSYDQLQSFCRLSDAGFHWTIR